MVYLIHFDQPLHHAQHYIGYVSMNKKLDERMATHLAGHGARLLAVLGDLGIGWSVVRTWPNESRIFERKLKNRKKARELCPICKIKNK